MAEPSKTPAPVEKKPPEYEQVMLDKRDAAAKTAYDKASPLGKSIPPVEKKAKGGSIRGGGIESKGKTKGKMI